MANKKINSNIPASWRILALVLSILVVGGATMTGLVYLFINLFS